MNDVCNAYPTLAFRQYVFMSTKQFIRWTFHSRKFARTVSLPEILFIFSLRNVPPFFIASYTKCAPRSSFRMQSVCDEVATPSSARTCRRNNSCFRRPPSARIQQKNKWDDGRKNCFSSPSLVMRWAADIFAAAALVSGSNRRLNV